MPLDKKAYHREYMRKKWAEDPEHRKSHADRVARNKKRYASERRALVEAFKANGCALCPEREPCCLSAHHLDPAQKDFTVGSVRRSGMSPAKVAEELKKCICLCENCHRKVHAGLIKIVL